MGPFCVVDLHCLINHLPRLLTIFRAPRQQLRLEDSVDSLGQRVLAFMDVVANDFPSVRIRYQAQIQRAVTCGQISNVGHPDVLWPCRYDLAWTGLNGAHPRPGKACLGPPGLVCQVGNAANSAAACPQTRLTHPDLLYELNHSIRLALFVISGLVALVNINDRLKELSLLAHQLKLLLEFFDSLLWSERFGVRHRAAPLVADRGPWLQSCRPCLSNHTRTVDFPWMPYRSRAWVQVSSPFSI
ncbi:hypothetical protein WR25_25678 [Diploscapter pachys]|uniref:Uncharacterized protein n=1 Tax=Diploscapter pachys TaxID=2018661 RepID=A0A2A2K632_9BILA|nr:hypothetical protein WR25_25678 [Diploscapter pachys]